MTGCGVLPSQHLRSAIAKGFIYARDGVEEEQIQPSSIDLRLGSTAYRVRASFLATRHATIAAKLDSFNMHSIDLRNGALFERGCIYIVPLKEELALPAEMSGKMLILAVQDHGRTAERALFRVSPDALRLRYRVP